MKQLKQHEQLCWYIGIILFYFIMAILTPLSFVDWHWYLNSHISSLGQDLMRTNGRYLGNFLEILAMQSAIFKYLSYTALSCLMVYFCTIIVNVNKKFIYILICFTFLIMIPSGVYSETYGWLAGFYNYIPSSIISLFILYTIIYILYGDEEASINHLWLFLTACLFGQLFIENITIYNSLIILIGASIYGIQHKKLNYYLIVGFMLSCIGAIIMFLNPIYFKIIDGKTVYHSISDKVGIIHKIGTTLLMDFPKYIFLNQYLILVVISVIITILLVRNTIFVNQHVVIKFAIMYGLYSLPFYKLLIYDQFHFEIYTKSFSIALLNFLICAVFFAVLIYSTVILISEKFLRAIALGCLISIVLSTLPLLVVAPIGNRNFYFIYVLWLIFLLCFVKQFDGNINKVTTIVKAIACAHSLILVIGFSLIYQSSVNRIENVEEQLKNGKRHQSIILERLPFEKYTHLTTPSTKTDLNDFKAYYDLPKDLKFKVVPFGYDGE